MDEKRLMEQIPRAVEAHCAHLHADPLLAQKVLHAAARKETPIVRSKMKFALILALILMLLTATAVAAVLLTAMEVIEQEAVPMAQSNDGEVRPVDEYTHEELKALIARAEENGIFLDDDTNVMRALRAGKGYWEEETIMAICREAFGGYIYEWSVEEQHFFYDVMVKIGWQDENYMTLPGEGEMSCEEARAFAVQILRENYGEALPLDDENQYRVQEGYSPYEHEGVMTSNWVFNFFPRTLDGATYWVSFDGDGAFIEHTASPAPDWSDYNERTLFERVEEVFNYRYPGDGMRTWKYDAWYSFGQKLAGARRSDKWNAEYDGYAATAYLLPVAADLTKRQARAIAFADAGVTDYNTITDLLLGKGDQRIWKISFSTTEKTGRHQVLTYEIDSVSGEILRREDLTAETQWARYMLHETYLLHRPEKTNVLTEDAALEKAIAALYRNLGREDIPYTDENAYTIDGSYNVNTGGYHFLFNPKVMEYGRASVQVTASGKANIWFVNGPELNGDNLFDRFEDVYGPNIYWGQDTWVKFGEEMKKYEATTFEGKLFKQTAYLPESAVKVSRDKAMDIVYIDSDHAEINRIVLIGAEPNPVWKVRASTWPVTTLYEVDAMTGEILDKEYYFIQMDNFDHTMMMYTLRRDYKPAALAEFGVKRLAMELCVKANVDKFEEESADYLMSGAYRITEEGMTVSFMAVDPRQASYIVTVAEDAMSADITVIPGVENDETLSRDQQAELYALFEGSERFVPLEELPEPYDSWENEGGPVEGEMTLAEAQAHAFSLLVDAVGQDTVDAFDKFAVGYKFSRYENDGHCIRWTFFFVSPDNINEGFRVTFAIRDNELWGDGQVSDINDSSNG